MVRMINPTPTNNLLSTIAGMPLDATQGKVLKKKIGLLSSLTTNVKTSIVAAINNLKAVVDNNNVVALMNPSYATLKEFVAATNKGGQYIPKMFRFCDTGGWGPSGISKWYRCIVIYQNPYMSGGKYDIGGDVLFFCDNNVLCSGYITGTYDADNLAITYKKIQTTDL